MGGLMFKKLKNIATIITGYTARQKDNTPTGACYELNSIKSLIIDPEDKRSYTFQGKDIFPYLISKHDIVIETRGAFKVGIILRDCNQLTINANQIKLRVNDKDIIPQYLCYYLNTNLVKDRLNKLRKGSNCLFLSTNDLGLIEVPILPKKKQKKIIEVIDKVEYYKELTQKALSKYELIPTAMFNKYIKEEQCIK